MIEDVTDVIFKHRPNVSVFYSSGESLENLITGSRILGITTYALSHACLGPYLAKDNGVVCLNVLPAVWPYIYGDYTRYDDQAKKIKDYVGYVERPWPDADFDFLWGRDLNFRPGSFDWVILDIDELGDYVLDFALGKNLDKILRRAKKLGSRVAYIRPVENDDADLVAKYSLERSRTEGKSFQETFEEVIMHPIEIQVDKKLPRIVSSFRAAGFRDVQILHSPMIRKNPYASLARNLFIYAEG